MLLPPPGNGRRLAFATFASAFGNGAYLAVSVLFLTRSVGLSPTVMAAGLSCGAIAGMLLTVPLGHIADVYGPKRTQLVAYLVLAVAYLGLLEVRGFWSFALTASVIAVGEATAKSANGAMTASAAAPDQRLRLRAFLRSATNAGVGLGTLAGAVPLLVNTRAAYTVVLVVDAVTFLIAAAVLQGADEAPKQPRPAGGPRLVVLRDRPFLVFAALDGVLTSIYNDLLGIGLPLLLVLHTHAPLWLVSGALVINTLGCVLLQVWAAKGPDNLARGSRTSRRGAILVGTACVLWGLAGGHGPLLVGTLVLGAALVHVLGELWMSTGSWTTVFGLAPDWAQGQYQATYFTGRQIGDMISPPLLAGCVVAFGLPGWSGLGLLYAVAGCTYPALVGWAGRSRRPSEPVPAAGPVAGPAASPGEVVADAAVAIVADRAGEVVADAAGAGVAVGPVRTS